MGVQLFSVTLIVGIGLTSAQSNVETGADPSGIQENFRNLFNSIRQNDLKETKNYRTFLEQEAVREQRSFNAMKKDLRFTRQKSAHNQRNLYLQKSDTGEKADVFKREAGVTIAEPDSENQSPSTSYPTPEILKKENFTNLVEGRNFVLLHDELRRAFNKTVVDLEGETREERRKHEALQSEMKKKLLPLRMCCEPQFLRYYINHGKVLSGVQRSNILFFLEERRKEWIERINENKGQHTLAGRLEQAIRLNNMTVEEFVNETDIMDMRASSAIHSYLSRTVRPMTPREEFAINRFTLSLFHGKVFNTLAAAMKTPPINVKIDGIVQIPTCNEILDLESDEMKLIMSKLF